MSSVPIAAMLLLIATVYLGNKVNTSAAAPPLLATSLNSSTKVGYTANIPGLHTPATLTTHSGNFTTSSNNQVIQNLNVTGRITVIHSNVTIKNVKARQIIIEAKTYPSASADISWSTIGDINGIRINPDGHYTIGNGNFNLYRSEVFGAVDLVQISCGSPQIIENWFHDNLQEPVDPGQNGGPSHSDPIQFVPTGYCVTPERIIDDVLIKGNRFDSWWFYPGQQAGANWGDVSSTSKSITSGMMILQSNTSQPVAKNISVIDNYVDGNYSWAWYSKPQNGSPGSYNPQNVIVTGNQFKKRFPGYGKNGYASVYIPQSGEAIQVTHGYNVDADSGATINVSCGSSCTKPAPPPTVPPPPPTPPPAPEPVPPPVPSPTPIPSPSPSPTPEPPPPVTIPDANPETPVEIPDELPVNNDGTIIADFNGDGLNEIVKDTNNDGKIDPKTEIIVDGTKDKSLTDTSKAAITAEEYKNMVDDQTPELQPQAGPKESPETVTINLGSLPAVRIPKPVAYTFVTAGTISLIGVGAYMAITKLTIFASTRGKLGL